MSWCRPACHACLRFVAFPSHLIGHRLARRLPVPRHGWRGVRRGASVLCLLGSALRSVPMSISRFMPFLLRCPLGLLACLARLRGSGVLISSCGMCCDVLLAHRPVSSLASFIIPSVGSVSLVSRPVSRHDGRGDGRLRLAIVLRFDFLLPASFPCACLPWGVSRHPSDADGGGGLRSVVSAGGLLACPVVSVPCRPFRFAARSFHLMARLIGAALCRPPTLWVWVRGGHAPAVHHPILPGCLLRAD